MLEDLDSFEQKIKTSESLSVDGEDTREILEGELNDLNEQIINLSKYCLRQLSGMNEELLSRLNDVNTVGSIISLIGDSTAHKTFEEGIVSGLDTAETEQIDNTESEEIFPLQIPKTSNRINFEILNDVGIDPFHLGESSESLVVALTPETPFQDKWKQIEDFFV